MNEFAVIGTLAAFLGTCMQLFDAVTRGSLRMALEDSNALDDLVKSQLRTYPVWHLRQRRQARGRLRSELLTPADQRRLVHANRQLLGWALIWVAAGYGVVASCLAAFLPKLGPPPEEGLARNSRVRNDAKVTFWWASQNRNYKIVIPEGTLWTRPWVNGSTPRNRGLIRDMQVDDIVFHYGKGYLRAVSRVTVPWVDAERPVGYRRGPREDETNDDGWLVRVEAIRSDLQYPREAAAELIRWGEGGPFTRFGVPQEKYISELTLEEGQALLSALDVELPTVSLPGRPHEDWIPLGGDTDRASAGTVRVEQGALRARLLGHAELAKCGLCGEMLPTELLVAAHITPRSKLTNEERLDFHAVATLMCILGCDALHEHGYSYVDTSGVIRLTAAGRSPAVDAALGRLSGRTAPAWNEQTAPYFERHASESIAGGA